MAPIRATAEINAPVAQVVAILLDVERWPEWTPTMANVRRIDQGPFEVGSSARVRQPRLMPAVWRVTELDGQTGFTWATHGPGFRITAEHRVETRGAGSRVILSLTFAGLLGPVIAGLVGSLSQRYLTIEADGLRKCCER